MAKSRPRGGHAQRSPMDDYVCLACRQGDCSDCLDVAYRSKYANSRMCHCPNHGTKESRSTPSPSTRAAVLEPDVRALSAPTAPSKERGKAGPR